MPVTMMNPILKEEDEQYSASIQKISKKTNTDRATFMETTYPRIQRRIC